MSTWRIWAYALFLAALWLGLRFAIGSVYNYNYLEARSWGVLLNLIFVLVLFILALYRTYSKEPQIRGYFDDFKLCLKSGVAYAVAIGIASTIYYSTASDMVIERTTRYQKLEEALDTPEEVTAIINSNEQYKNFTKEEIQQDYIEHANTMTSVKTIVAGGISGMIICSLIYSLIVPFVFRTVMLKELQ